MHLHACTSPRSYASAFGVRIVHPLACIRDCGAGACDAPGRHACQLSYWLGINQTRRHQTAACCAGPAATAGPGAACAALAMSPCVAGGAPEAACAAEETSAVSSDVAQSLPRPEPLAAAVPELFEGPQEESVQVAAALHSSGTHAHKHASYRCCAAVPTADSFGPRACRSQSRISGPLWDQGVWWSGQHTLCYAEPFQWICAGTCCTSKSTAIRDARLHQRPLDTTRMHTRPKLPGCGGFRG